MPFEVIARPHPFRQATIRLTLDDGATVEDAIRETARAAYGSDEMLGAISAYAGDERLDAELWRGARPKPGTTLIITSTPEGDGFGSLLLQLAGFALSFAVPALGPAIGTAFGTINVGTVLIKAAITIGISLLSQALAPAPKQPTRDSEPSAPATFSITATRNNASVYGAVPRVYGRVVNYFPLLAAQPYTSLPNNRDQDLTQLFCAGARDLLVEDLRIGDRDIYSYVGALVEVNTSEEQADPITLYPAIVRPSPEQFELLQSAGLRTIDTIGQADEMQIDISFPRGLLRSESNEDGLFRYAASVAFAVQFQDLDGGVGTGQDAFSYTARTSSLIRFTRSIRFPYRSRWRVKIARLTTDVDFAQNGSANTTSYQWSSVISAVRSVVNEPPVLNDRAALIAIRLRSSDQLNGAIDSFNLTATSILPVWTGSEWIKQPTRNPAWIFCDVLRGDGSARPFDDSQIDLDAMLSWAAYCEAERFYFDGVIDSQRSVSDVLDDVASTGRASKTFVDGRWSVVVDRERDIDADVVQMFTPRNSWGFSSSKIFVSDFDAVKIRFPSKETGRQEDERIIYRPGVSPEQAVKFEAITLPYTSEPEAAFRFGLYYIAAASLRPEIYEFSADIESIVCQRGDLIRIAHDAILVGLGYGRVLDVYRDEAGNCTGVRMDAQVPMEGGRDYAIRFRQADGASLLRVITPTYWPTDDAAAFWGDDAAAFWPEFVSDAISGLASVIAFSTPISAGDPQPAIGDLAAFGEVGRETGVYIVRSIRARADLSATITAVDYNPAVYTADRGTIPPYTPGITIPPRVRAGQLAAPQFQTIVSDESVIQRTASGDLIDRVVASYVVPIEPSLPAPDAVEARYYVGAEADMADPAWEYLPAAPVTQSSLAITGVTAGDEVRIQLRAINNRFSLTSRWQEARHTVVGKSTPPPDVPGALVAAGVLSWNYPAPPIDLAGYIVRANYGNDRNPARARTLTPAPITEQRFDLSGLSGTQTIFVYAVDVAGNESRTPAIVALDLGDVRADNIVIRQDERALGWPGDSANAEIGPEGQLRGVVVGGGPFWQQDADPHYTGADADPYYPDPAGAYAALEYVAVYEVQPTDRGVATLLLEIDADQIDALEFRALAKTPYYGGADSDPFWEADEADHWPLGEQLGDYQPWPGRAGPVQDEAAAYQWRLRLRAGNGLAPEVRAFAIVVDVPDIREAFEDVLILAAGTRLPITRQYRKITNVTLTLQDDGGDAVTLRVIDKDPALGPLVQALDAGSPGDMLNPATPPAPTTALIDATVAGY